MGGRVQACLADGFREEVFGVNMLLFVMGVAGDIDYFHSVQEGGVEGLENICCANEEAFRQIDRSINIIIRKTRILLRIQYFQQNRRRVPMTTALPHFIHLVYQDHRVLNPRCLQSIDYLSRNRPNIGSSVPFEGCRVPIPS